MIFFANIIEYVIRKEVEMIKITTPWTLTCFRQNDWLCAPNFRDTTVVRLYYVMELKFRCAKLLESIVDLCAEECVGVC